MTSPLFLRALLTLTLASPALAEGPFRELSFDDALVAAEKANTVVFVDFFTTWCGPCKKLDRVTWKDEAVQAWLTANTVPVKIDAQEEPKLTERFGVEAFPTLLLIDPDGVECGRIVGYLDPEEFITAAREALKGFSASERVERKLLVTPNDPALRKRHGAALVQEGRFEEALAEYLWCYDEGLNHSPSFRGVRSSFLLSSINSLGKRYPEAWIALREREAAARESVLSGEGDHQAAGDVVAICRELGESKRILELWDALIEQDRMDARMRQTLIGVTLDLLMEAGRYRDALHGVGDIDAYFDQKIAMFKMATTDQEDEDLRDYMLRSTLVDVARIYGALLGSEDDRASAYAKSILAFNTSDLAYAQLVRAAARVESWAAARELLTQAYELLPEEERGAVRAAERKLPKSERPASGV